MPVKTFKPTTPGRRQMSVSSFAEITRSEPEKSLIAPLSKSGGRNNRGRVTSRWIGGGHKRRYRMIDFKRNKDGVPAKVVSIEYDPNRTAHLALLQYVDGEKRYILAPAGVKVGTTLMSGEGAEIHPGNCLKLRHIPVGSTVHNIELRPGKGAQLVRSAGNSAQVLAREGEYATIRLQSGEVRLIHRECRATLGQIGNAEHENINIGKAGRSRWMGKRPEVRGVAMNPVDHPHGGGEGKTSGGRHPSSPWGWLTKGYRTRKKKNASSKFIIKRRNQR